MTRAMCAARGVVALRARPSETSEQHTQLLFGERFDVLEDEDGWSHGQSVLDGYAGYVRTDALAAAQEPTHRVSARATPMLVSRDVKEGIRDMLPMNAKVCVAEMEERFARLTHGLHVHAHHLSSIDRVVEDWVAVAESFVGTPYLWGGKTGAGMDCSGLVQTALEAGGIRSPRDSGMMETALGEAIGPNTALERGDLVFWQGHVAIMLDPVRLIHASAASMQVCIAKLSESPPVRNVRRVRRRVP